ncbi:pantoate--beta-alanine ligase [Candidatus Micrarchaeota archaeon]|nr:pantoate--beta-alanine ligase [Candidatus Micrarchaeota archaeon]
MWVFKQSNQMSAWAHGKNSGFVPTMGFLHEGHLSLVRRAKNENDVAVASIFVNPAQFGPAEDFDAYPHDLDRDLNMLEKEGVDAVFTPSVQELYPNGPEITVRAGPLSLPLEGQFRPGHFDGVCTVVKKLFDVVQPETAYFGQKDFQQFLVIQEMVQSMKLGVNVVVCPTIREIDGLAKSSRNVYFSNQERKKAPLLYSALREAEKKLVQGKKPRHVENEAKLFLEENGFRVQYFRVASAETLEPVSKPEGRVLVAAAAFLGKTRLVDNVVFVV